MSHILNLRIRKNAGIGTLAREARRLAKARKAQWLCFRRGLDSGGFTEQWRSYQEQDAYARYKDLDEFADHLERLAGIKKEDD